MALSGVYIYCPRCEKIQICASIPLHGKRKSRRWCAQKYDDIQWFMRSRQCTSCQEVFLTAEIDEALIIEFIKLREKFAEKQNRIMEQVRERAPWITRTETIPLYVAKEFVERSAWWLTHSSGWPVRAPRHADRIYNSHHGWAIDFGANTFLVGSAVERCRVEIGDYLDLLVSGQAPPLNILKQTLKQHISGAVANANGYEYSGYYPINDEGRLVFGAQAIDVDDGVAYIFEATGIDRLL